jgi:D-beta-D-heptose 7-phosphate kinase/D-beta-D-heptose 1-phosphate adenosyltransferase
MNPDCLLEALDRVGSPRLLVVGDLILDRYVRGTAERVSPEAAALVLRPEAHSAGPGGAAAVATLARALGAEVALAGLIGCDADGRELRRLLADAGVDTSLVGCDVSRPTTTKERFLGRAGGAFDQQLLRVDRESRQPLARAVETRLLVGLTAAVGQCRAVLLADYGKGVCTVRLLRRLFAAARARRVPVFVDPAPLADFARYRGAALLAPNRREAERADGMTITSVEDALAVGQRLCSHYEAAALVKLDADGLVLVRHSGSGRAWPAVARQVRDVAGAGDMVLATMGLCRAGGLTWEEAAGLAAVAAGWEVGQPGVAPLTRPLLRAELLRRQPGARGKLVPAEDLAALGESYRREGRRVVFTNGCFDLLHAGHVACLEQAARLGDVLVVGLNSDRSVRRLKGLGRPVVGEEDRAALVAALACVGHVVVFDEDTPHGLLERLRPEVLAKGGTTQEVVGREVVEGYGGKVCLLGTRPGLSTTALVSSIRASVLAEP